MGIRDPTTNIQTQRSISIPWMRLSERMISARDGGHVWVAQFLSLQRRSFLASQLIVSFGHPEEELILEK